MRTVPPSAESETRELEEIVECRLRIVDFGLGREGGFEVQARQIVPEALGKVHRLAVPGEIEAGERLPSRIFRTAGE